LAPTIDATADRVLHLQPHGYQPRTASPTVQEVADALAITLERQDADGAPWCPPRDGVAVRRWVTDRSAALGGGIRRVVRLARLMAVADGRDYVQFLYVSAAAEGRLPSRQVTFTDTGVLLREAAQATQRKPEEGFEIDFAQMPRLAALLDFLHNALGFGTVHDVLAPLLHGGGSTQTATEIARTLHAALNAWLSERLESPGHMRQAQRMRAFLASRGHVNPEAIDNEAILLFWMGVAVATDEDRIDGFRLFTSAAGAMLRYRQALRDAATARQLEASFGSGKDSASAQLALDRLEDSQTSLEMWRSPLRALASLPASRIKWLTKKEQHRLLHYLGGPASDEVPQDSDDEGQSGHWHGGLAGDERFDLAYLLTLLRADVFGAVQASIVGRLRKRAAADAAIELTLQSIGEDAYGACSADYSSVCEQLRLECLAALAALMEAGSAEAVILLGHLGGQEAVTAAIGPTADELPSLAEDGAVPEAMRRLIATALQAVLADPNSLPPGAGREVLLQARAATRTVSRIGFRREDYADAEMLAALQSGTAAVVEVLRDLDRLQAALSSKSGLGDVADDQARFADTFRAIYLPSTPT
jgi:hypothetical protein